jgi:hypothetical protein
MAHYRIFFMNINGRIPDPPEERERVDDPVAIERARPLLIVKAHAQ